jgi:hypothetical protein
MLDGRRSGAQRGALENNFGQRFSWAPLAFSARQSIPLEFTWLYESGKRELFADVETGAAQKVGYHWVFKPGSVIFYAHDLVLLVESKPPNSIDFPNIVQGA